MSEIKRRIRVAAAAYAYEVENDPIMSDAEFDKLARSIDVTIHTNRADLDQFFRTEFSPHTGHWVHRHPEKERLAYFANLYRKEPTK